MFGAQELKCLCVISNVLSLSAKRPAMGAQPLSIFQKDVADSKAQDVGIVYSRSMEEYYVDCRCHQHLKNEMNEKKRSATFNDHAKRKIKTTLKIKTLTNPVSQRSHL